MGAKCPEVCRGQAKIWKSIEGITYKTGSVENGSARSVISKCEKLEPTDSSVEFQGAFDGVSGLGEMKFVHKNKR